MKWSVTLCSILSIILQGCEPAQFSQKKEVAEADPTPRNGKVAAWFVDATAEVRLNFTHDAGRTGSYAMPQVLGSGAALFDSNGDGRLDIFLLQNHGPHAPPGQAGAAKIGDNALDPNSSQYTEDSRALPSNRTMSTTNRLFVQEFNGTFRDASDGSGLDVTGTGMGIAVGDVNNDGQNDLLLTEVGRTRLFLRQLDADKPEYLDVTAECGIANLLWGTSAAFADVDRDGWLDLVVVNYLDYDPTKPCVDPGGKADFCGPDSFAGTVARLYRNRGGTLGQPQQSVRFDDVTVASGLATQPGPGLGIVCADFNHDRWPDILIANDGRPNHLWINQRGSAGPRFTEEAVVRGIAFNRMGKSEANMGIAFGDVTGDGSFDVFITHLTGETNALWQQSGRGQFRDVTAPAQLASPRWRATGFGAVFADFDHDGDLDLAVANGRVKRNNAALIQTGSTSTVPEFWQAYAERNQLFANNGRGRFDDVSESNPAFCLTPAVGRGLACGDVDNDGDLDLLVTSIAGPARILRNEAPKRGRWLIVRALDPLLRRDAHDAEITVHAGDRSWKRWLNPCYSYLCSNDPRAHFGLGPIDHVDKIEVLWPDGELETFPSHPVNKLLVLRKGEGEKTERRSALIERGSGK